MSDFTPERGRSRRGDRRELARDQQQRSARREQRLERSESERQARLDVPKDTRRLRRPRFEDDAFGRFAEQFARFMGTARFLLYMTAFIIVWIILNSVALFGFKWDAYPFILLNLCFSVQASYAAPLILLAQNRQDDRDRVALEQDRQQAERNLADTEFLTREIAALRIALSEVATRDFVRSELRDLFDELREEQDEPAADDPGASD